MTTTAPVRSPSRVITNAANSGSGATPGTCQDCNKKGVAILPVVPGLLPNAAKASLTGLDAWYDSSDLKEHWYFLRALPTGYLYVLKSDKSGQAPSLGGWDVYIVDADGLLRKTAPASQAQSPGDVTPMSEACRRKGDNVPTQVIAIDPDKHPAAWMAFSRYRWTTDVLAHYAKNVEGCRDQRMRAINVTAVAAGQLGKGQAVPFGMKMGPQLAQAVADYGPNATRNTVNQHALVPVRGRGEQVAALTTVMAEISKATPAKCGAVIVLSDVVGNTQDLNFRRNRLAADSAHTAGMGDPERSRRRVVAEVIEGIRASAETNPGPWWDRNYGPERFLKHIKQDEWKKAREEGAQFKALLARIDKVSADYVNVKESTAWLAQQKFDFDSADDTAARDHGNMVASCLAGSGLTQVEREKVWQPVLEAIVQPADNWLDRALVALYPSALTYIQTDNKQDKAYDAVKGAAAISRELTSEGLK
ncbi:MAG: T6SS effector BTH_I2691 family protein, partial [Burkholderiales bacterium]